MLESTLESERIIGVQLHAIAKSRGALPERECTVRDFALALRNTDAILKDMCGKKKDCVFSANKHTCRQGGWSHV